jgi:magnesium-transporting ATPase (P-type)
MALPCDAILLEGQCLVDESALTGESVPMHKVQLPNNLNLFTEDEKSHLLFSGTRCLTSEKFNEISKPALAVVHQTGFSTSRGLLIRAIMFNDNGKKYRFERDGNLFLLYLILISFLFIAIYYIIAFSGSEPAKFSEVWLPSIDIMLVMVPPGLTLCLGIGVQYAQQRLMKEKISVMKGRLINAAGRMKVVLFDKTGTLTINEVVLDEVYIYDRLEDGSKCRKLPRERDEKRDQLFQQRLVKHFAADHTLIKMRSL